MNYLKMGNKTIYYFGNKQFAMTEDGRNYILYDTKWIDANTHKFHRIVNLTDKILLEELEEK